MFQKNAKHRANVASNAVHRPPLVRVHQLIHFVSVEKACSILTAKSLIRDEVTREGKDCMHLRCGRGEK